MVCNGLFSRKDLKKNRVCVLVDDKACLEMSNAVVAGNLGTCGHKLKPFSCTLSHASRYCNGKICDPAHNIACKLLKNTVQFGQRM
jgi:hypothetical protein